jgi:hypothetical protein
MKENDIRSRATVDKYLELVEKDCETFFQQMTIILILPAAHALVRVINRSLQSMGFIM